MRLIKLTLIITFWWPAIVVTGEAVDTFDVRIAINEDGTVQIAEQVVYDFGNDQRHGIFRDIPYRYHTDIGSYRARISDIRVENEHGIVRPFVTSKQSDNLRIKIGNPDAYVSGLQTYVIYYTVEDVISYFNTYDELYWNVTGSDWAVPIRAVSGIIAFPGNRNVSFDVTNCYQGLPGSRATCDLDATRPATERSPETYQFLHAKELTPGTGVTIAVSFPKGNVYEPTIFERVSKFVRDNWVVAIPIVVFLIMWRLWFERGRDPKGRATIIPQYDAPKNLTPAEVGTIYDERVNQKDIAAEIISLAVQGYLKIFQVEKKIFFITTTDYFLVQLKQYADLDRGYDRRLMKALFQEKFLTREEVDNELRPGVLMSKLSQKFAADYKKIEKAIYGSVTDQKFFTRNPHTDATMYGAIAIGIFVLMTFLGGFGSVVLLVSVGMSAAIIFVFSFAMPQRTRKGVRQKEYIEGLKRYLEVAEKDRLAFHNRPGGQTGAPEKTPERFDTLLPFAMALGVEKAWAEQFAGIEMGERSWYGGTPGQMFTPTVFASELSAFSAAAGNNLSAAKGGSGTSGGGGFSGGGFGGGGGGSW